MNRILLAALACAVIAPLPCYAQFGAAPPGPGTLGAMSKKSAKGGETKPGVREPAALPGTRAPGEAAPATQSAADMSPTEALFDAINRGDTPAARDAVNRGANLDAQNLIGLTPLELSVDLARNDISFLLLSMRGADPGAGRDRDVGVRMTAPARAARPMRVMAEPRAAPEARTVAAPRLYSGNGGAPIPGAGFTGFGGRSVQ